MVLLRVAFLLMMFLIACGMNSANASAVDLPDTNRVNLSVNPNAVVRVYETDDPAYYQYINSRFSFLINFPSNFTIALKAGDNGSVRFSTSDGKSDIMVWGSHNTQKISVNDEYCKAIKHIGQASISYKAYGDDWYIISWVEGERSYYEKVFISDDYRNGFLLTYPEKLKDKFNDVVIVIEQSFIPGWKSGREILG